MVNHIISRADEAKLFELESSAEYQGCINVVSQTIATIDAELDEDLKYELGATYLRLALYYSAIGNNGRYSTLMDQAKAILPQADQLALAAIWLDRFGINKSLVNELSVEFFHAADQRFRKIDGISNMYYEAMLEIREKLNRNP